MSALADVFDVSTVVFVLICAAYMWLRIAMRRARGDYRRKGSAL